MSQLHWWYITHTLVYGPTILAVYDPAILAIHHPYTSAWANYVGSTLSIHQCMDQLYWQFCSWSSSVWASFIQSPVHGPAILAIHSSYTSVWANHTGNFVVPGPMYGPAMLAIHHPYTSVWPNYTGHTSPIHWCITQLYWQFCNPRSGGGTSVYDPTMLAFL